jgi:cytochrome c oxidase subunit II
MTLWLAFAFGDWFPRRASTLAPRVDATFAVLVAFSLVLVVGLAVANLYFLVKYRRGSPALRPPLRISTAKLETGWISATTLAFLGFFFMGARVYLDEEHPPADALEIHVTGRQWMWDVRHANGRREFDELHVPAGENIRLVMNSEDVIHSFYVPAFRLKQDVVPGKQVSMWFRPTQPGRYHLFCAEFCGTKHSGMTGDIVVLPSENYARWLTTGNPPTPLAIRGRQLFTRYNCSGCHDQPAAVHAPPLDQLYGSLVPLRDGRFARVDDSYIRDSILQPAKDVVAGYEPLMPSFQGVIPENDLLDLIAYLKSLPAATSLTVPAATVAPATEP